MAKNKGGRPSAVDDAVLLKLEHAFSIGCSDLDACMFADISKTALYNYQVRHPEFKDRKEVLKRNPLLKAKQAMMECLESENETIKSKAAIDTIDRYEGKAQGKLELTGAGGGPIQVRDMTDDELDNEIELLAGEI